MTPPATPLSTLFILAVLALMGVLIWRKLNVLWVLLIATGAVLVLFMVNPILYLKTVVDPDGPFLLRSAKLMVLVYIINLLGFLMREAGREKELVCGLEAAFGDRRVMAAFTPMAMGLLPMPGGAILSASMVQMTLAHQSDNGHKSAVNMWFRHVWELVDPLYPGIILSSQMLAVSFVSLSLANWNVFWAMLLFGAIFLLKDVVRIEPQRTCSKFSGLVMMLKSLVPIAVAFGVTLLDGVIKGAWARHFVGALPGVTAGVISAVLLWKINWHTFVVCAKKAVEARMQLIVVFSLLLATAIEVSGAVGGMKADFNHYGLPTIIIIALLPFLTGFLTGVTMAFVSMSMPVVVAMTSGTSEGLITGFSVAYTAGFIGVFYSPVHLCMLLSAEKFGTDLWSTYRWMIWPGVAMLAVLILQVAVATWGPGLL